jgi:hypothetical protein
MRRALGRDSICHSGTHEVNYQKASEIAPKPHCSNEPKKLQHSYVIRGKTLGVECSDRWGVPVSDRIVLL